MTTSRRTEPVAVRLPQGAELTQEQVEKAALVVADRAVNVADARDLLEMLGLVDVGDATRTSCGTVPGWHRHQQLNEAPCDSCREAWNAYQVRRARSGGAK